MLSINELVVIERLRTYLKRKSNNDLFLEVLFDLYKIPTDYRYKYKEELECLNFKALKNDEQFNVIKKFLDKLRAEGFEIRMAKKESQRMFEAQFENNIAEMNKRLHQK